jgi:site-specific DNA recombinase
MEHCATHRYRVNQQHIYKDVWTGTEYMERPELSKLREDARDSLFDIVVIYAFDRLARKQVHQAVIIEDLRRSEVNVESVTENFDDSAVGQFLRNAAAFAAELEHEKIRERTQRGRLQKLKNGKLLGAGIAPYGYDWNEDRTAYVINPQEAEVVKLVFQMYAYEGLTMRAIMFYLRENVPTTKRGRGLWQGSTLQRMLRNPLYIGECAAYKWHEVREGEKRKRMTVRPLEERIKLPEGVAPAIIDKETFEIIQAKMEINKRLAARNNKDPERSLLRCGFAICGNCGHNLLAQRKPPSGRSLNDAYVYACHDSEMPTRCNKVSIRTHILDDEVWKYVEGLIQNPAKVEARLAELEAKLTRTQR